MTPAVGQYRTPLRLAWRTRMWCALGGHHGKSPCNCSFLNNLSYFKPISLLHTKVVCFFQCWAVAPAAGGVVSGESGGVGRGPSSRLTCVWRLASGFLCQVWPFHGLTSTACIMLSGLIADFWLSFNVCGTVQKLWQSPKAMAVFAELWKEISLWRMEEYCQM